MSAKILGIIYIRAQCRNKYKVLNISSSKDVKNKQKHLKHALFICEPNKKRITFNKI